MNPKAKHNYLPLSGLEKKIINVMILTKQEAGRGLESILDFEEFKGKIYLKN